MYKRSAHGLRHDAHLARAELLPAAKMRDTLIHLYVELGEQAEATRLQLECSAGYPGLGKLLILAAILHIWIKVHSLAMDSGFTEEFGEGHLVSIGHMLISDPHGRQSGHHVCLRNEAVVIDSTFELNSAERELSSTCCVCETILNNFTIASNDSAHIEFLQCSAASPSTSHTSTRSQCLQPHEDDELSTVSSVSDSYASSPT